jgi:CRP/FNR family transcriptional regulator, cyclic AMP receptor protein
MDWTHWNDIPERVAEKIAALPIKMYLAGNTVLAAGLRSGRLLFLKKGAVAVVKDGIEIAKVTEPGAVFGEISALLDCPHTADVLALEDSQFYVAHAATLQGDPVVLIYVAALLARRLDGANQALIDLKKQIRVGQPQDMIDKTIEMMEGLLGASPLERSWRARYAGKLAEWRAAR